MTASPLRRYPFGPGVVTCDLGDGTPLRIEHPALPGATFLLDDRDADWHNAPYRWGKGFLISDAGAARWDQPEFLRADENGFTCIYEPLTGVQLTVQRQFGARWTERYRLTNSRPAPLTITCLAISTPWRDVYHAAHDSLGGNCNAHIWTGGAWAYVWAVPMSGAAPGLGLALTDGELWAYSIETRNPYPQGHNRGHIYLHATDAARNPTALGGQPMITIASGQSYTLAWELGWFAEYADFAQELVRPPVDLPTLAAPLGAALRLEHRTPEGLAVTAPAGVIVNSSATGVSVVSEQPGIAHLDLAWSGRRARVSVMFHHPLRTLVERRAAFILAHQRADERAEDRCGAFLPYDTRWGLRLNGGNWLDWSDARERVGMPILLQELRRRGWGDATAIDAALADFDRFCRSHIVGDDGAVFEHSYRREASRLYNFPWFADFYLGQYALFNRSADLELAVRILERYYALGGGRFLAIGLAEAAEGVIAALERANDPLRAAALREHLLAHADHFVAAGRNLPSHEVHYEQSIVAPLLSLLITGHRNAPERGYAEALRERLPWLLAFGGPQPHVRLRNVAIRHWDGYWFGALRRWGDVFPHYWSALSAVVLARWPADVPLSGLTRTAPAYDMLTANLADFSADGAASCAFIFPSCVDGNPAHEADPVANDQDWALVFALRYGAWAGLAID